MILGGCSTTSSVNPQKSAIEEATEFVQAQSCKIDPEFLKPCKWLKMPKKFDETSILLNYTENSEIHADCYVRHNKFVETYNNENAED